MNDPSQHELLSAYLDGELPAEERARVERWLDEDAAARRRLDELRAVTVSMKNLPAHRLDEDLSARVLRAAEHRILAEPAATADDAPRPAATDETRSTRRILRRFLTPRAIAWSGVAIAVAILLTVIPLEQPRELA
ncbi:MAG: zf-HC2 domain-containing protein, partial [Pirellulales bacterium]|nr:zf-HC2 domain-containing protein [Pirellulales bacterium]